MEGTICFKIRFTAASRKSNFGIFRKPSLNSQGSWNDNCNTPPTNTAQPSAIIGGSKYGTKNTAKTINEIFSRTGVNAGMENWLYVFRMLPTKDDSEISRI